MSTSTHADVPAPSGYCCVKWQASPYWNIVWLALAWALTLSTSTLLTTIGPLSAENLGASKALSSFTVGCFLIGAAVSSVPSGWLFRNFGRYWGFTVGCFFQLLGSVLGTIGLGLGDSGLAFLYMGCFSVGLAQGLGQFYRFAAVELTPPEFKSRAITYVLAGGILAAFVGPTVADQTANVFGQEYMASYGIIALIAFLNQLVISMVNFPKIQPAKTYNDNEEKSMNTAMDVNDGTRVRPTWEIVKQPLFMLSCAIATLAHTIMVMLMSNVALDMEDNGFSLGKASVVLELHFFAMFAPGFISGKLIERLGTFQVALIGGMIFAGSSVLLAVDDAYWNYIVGMIFVGVAWNFSFSAGTVMLTSCYQPKEATNVQAVNDFILFSVAGSGSLISGVIYADAGWLSLIYVVSGLMVLYLLLFSTAIKNKDELENSIRQSLLAPSLTPSMDPTGLASPPRSKTSISEMVRKMSFTTPADIRDHEMTEEEEGLIGVRSISVA